MTAFAYEAPRKTTCIRSIPIIAVHLLFLTAIYGQRPSLTIPLGHGQAVNSVDFSGDGKLIATGSPDNSVIIWDAATNFMIRRIRAEGPVQQVLFIPGKAQLIVLTGQSEGIYTSLKKNVLQLWDVQTGKLLRKLPFTASPGLRFLRSSPILLAPDYSGDLSDRKQNNMDKNNILDLNGLAKKYDEKYMDSMQTVMDKKVKEMEKTMGKPDYNDPKKMKEYMEKMMGQLADPDKIEADQYERNISLLEGVHFTPLVSLKDVPDNIQALYYNREEYILKPKYGTGKNSSRILAWPVGEFFKSNSEKREIRAAREFNAGKDIDVLAGSSSKGFFASGSHTGEFTLWQFDKTTPLVTLKSRGSHLVNMEFSLSGDTLYVYSMNTPVRYIEAWSTGGLKEIINQQVPDRYLGMNTWASPSRKYFLTAHGFGLAEISKGMGEEMGLLQGKAGRAAYCGFNKDDQEVYVNYNGMPFENRDLTTDIEKGIELEAQLEGKQLSKAEKDKRVKERKALVSRYSIDPKLYKGFLLDWDLLRGGAHMRVAGAYTEQHRTVSNDNNYQVYNEVFESSARDGVKATLRMVDSVKRRVSADTALLLGSVFDSTGFVGRQIRAGTINGPVTLLVNRKTKDTISLINIDSSDWIMLLKSGYYMTSRNGAKALSYTNGQEALPFAQFDIQYNRPDLVLKAIGKADTALIGAYRNAYLTRIRKLGIDTSQFRNDFNVPEADFLNRDQIREEQTSDKLQLMIGGQDKSKTLLDRYNIWVNEVPLFGKTGKSLREAKSSTLATTVEITLSQGKNNIEVSVMNARGVESYRRPLKVEYKSMQPKEGKLYFIGIGIGTFADTSQALRYCEKDIRDLAGKIGERYGTRMESTLLFNKDVTTENIKALKRILLQSSEDDKVIVAYSGHGLLNRKYEYFLSTYSVNFGEPGENGLPYDELVDLLDGIKARKKLLLIDACHSGELDKEEMLRLQAAGPALAKTGVTAGGKGIIKATSPRLGARNSFELMQELFVNVGRGTGATIIGAAAGTQLALERAELKNGVFTYAILELLQTGKPVTLSELKRHVSKRVAELTDNMQQPTTRNEIQNTDWEL